MSLRAGGEAIPKKNKYPPLVGGSKSQISRRGKTYAKNKSNLTPHPTLRVTLSLLDYSGPPRRWRGQERSNVRPAPYGFRFAPPYRKSATRGEGTIPFTLHFLCFTYPAFQLFNHSTNHHASLSGRGWFYNLEMKVKHPKI